MADALREVFIEIIQRETRRPGPFPALPGLALVHAHLEQVATQKPYTLWTDQTYIDRTVARTEDLFARTVARYDPRTPERESKAKPEALEEALTREGKLVLLGEPGLGKTTSLVHLTWEAANRALAKSPAGSEPAGGSPEIPIYVELKYYNGEAELETLLARRVNEILRIRNLMLAPDLAESTRMLKAWLMQSAARFLLLLDGLNEVRPEFHTAVRGALQALLNSPHHIVISCREYDYDESLRDRAAAFVLQGLQEDEIRDYLQRVLGANGERLFEEQIRWDEKMRTLAANPLMLWLINVVARGDPKARLPANRGKLFQQFVAMMPGLRAREGIRTEVPPAVVTATLAKLGFEMQERGRLVVDLGEMLDWQIPATGRQLEDVLAQAKEWRFLKSDGRLGEPVEFLHQLFLEYFATVHLRRQLEEQPDYHRVLNERPFKREWDEVIVMLAGIGDQPAELVKWLAAQVVEKGQGRAAFLVQSCWEASEAVQNSEMRNAVVNALLAALRDPDAVVRGNAAGAMREIGIPAVAPLLAALRDPDRDVRRGAADILVKIGAPAIAPLIAALRDPDDSVHRSVANALVKIGAPAVTLLIAALRDPDRNVRKGAADILVKIGAPAVAPLSAALHDPDCNVRRGAADALGQISNRRAVAPLIAALRDPDDSVRRSVADALVKIGAPAVAPLITALRDPSRDVRRGAADALSKIGDPQAIESLIVTLRDPDDGVRRGAADALVKIGAPAVKPLIVALCDPNDSMREEAADALGKIGAPAVELLIAALRDSDRNVRRSAADALVKIGVPAVAPLIAALRDHAAGMRRHVAGALGEIGDPRAVEPLSAVLCDPDWRVREEVADALGKIRDPRAVAPLIAALRDPGDFVRQGAAHALGEIGDPRAVEPLSAALRDPDLNVRRGAADALVKIGAPAVEPLIAALRDLDWRVREEAADALRKISDPCAVESLIAALCDPNEWVRGSAAYALGAIGDPRALPELERVAREDEGKTWRGERVAKAARWAVEKIWRRRSAAD